MAWERLGKCSLSGSHYDARIFIYRRTWHGTCILHFSTTMGFHPNGWIMAVEFTALDCGTANCGHTVKRHTASCALTRTTRTPKFSIKLRLITQLRICVADELHIYTVTSDHSDSIMPLSDENSRADTKLLPTKQVVNYTKSNMVVLIRSSLNPSFWWPRKLQSKSTIKGHWSTFSGTNASEFLRMHS